MRVHRITKSSAVLIRNSQSTFRPTLKDRPLGPSRHVGRAIGGQLYKAGEIVRQTGIYEVTHDRAHRTPHDVVMLAADVFRCVKPASPKFAFDWCGLLHIFFRTRTSRPRKNSPTLIRRLARVPLGARVGLAFLCRQPLLPTQATTAPISTKDCRIRFVSSHPRPAAEAISSTLRFPLMARKTASAAVSVSIT
jgi:hypothetical protein